MARTISSVTKDGQTLIITFSDGEVLRRSVIYSDTVVSVPPDGSSEVGNVYVNASSQLVVSYNGSSLVLEDNLTGVEIVTLLEALGAGSRLSHTKLDDVGASDHHSRYTDAEAAAQAIVYALALGA